MECNKEEAFRAREIAEKKMQNKDFIGAQKIAQRAQHLYPELENISQILTVCEVHCSADVKVNGLMDWYGILQVEPTADDLSIKKQYRKLALLLHPDKNQFPGAEAAFKLIGEAHMFLSDQSKRCIYDTRRDATKHVPSNQSPAQMGKSSVQRNFNAGQSSGVNQQQQQPSQFADSLTFWTACPDCSIRYQYFRSVLNKTIHCPNCLKPFVAYDLNEKSVPREVNLGQSVNNFGNLHQQVQTQKTNQSKQQRQCGIGSSSMGVKESVGGGPKIHFDHGGEPVTVAASDKLGASKEVKFVKRNPGEMNQGELATKPPTANVNRKTGRKVAVEPRDSVSSGVKNITKEDRCQAKHSSTTTPTRRSSRLKQNNNHNEVRSENDNDDFIIPHKKLRESSSGNNSHEADANFVTSRPNSADVRMEDSHRGDPSQKTVPHGSEGANRDSIGENKQELVAGEKSERGSKSHVDSTSNSLPESQTFTYPDSEFGNFEESRHLNEFAVDQIWAVYDDLDGMPRFYALIRKIHVPHAKLRFTWLEHNPLNEAEIAWSDANLPVGFGNYLLGSSHVNEDLLMFSHVIPWEKGKKRNSYVIYPRKGEVWALFKDWNVQWTSDAENRLFEYEVVEVLSDFKTETGTCVTRLIRIEGFFSLFMQIKEKPYVILPNEVLRFSHNIPSYRLSGTEKEGIPQGCMELDPASLPANFAESFPSISLENSFGKEFSRSCLNSTTVEEEPGIRRAQEMETEVGQNLPNDVKSVDDSAEHPASQKQHSDAWRNSQIDAEQAEVGISQKDYLDAMDTHGNATGNEKVSSLSTLSHLTCECPEAEFHNFDEGKSVENVQQGQVWALFTNIDKYPKYYAWVKEVNLEGFRVQMSWLEACPVFEEEIRWLQESMPIACGTFKVEQESMIVDKIGMFSHLVQPKIARRNRYVILPSCGEVWAVYKNWAAGWSYSDWENCEYDVVEICECADVAMKVRPLKKVNGYRAVFKPEMQGKSMTLEIPIDEYTRFSHKIPAFLLTNEVEGKLRGYWELDAASVPEILLLSNTA